MFSHVSHSLVSALVRDSMEGNNQNVAPFVMIFQVAHYSNIFEVDVVIGKVVIQLF